MKRFIVLGFLLAAAFAAPHAAGAAACTWTDRGGHDYYDNVPPTSDIDNLNDVVSGAPNQALPVYIVRTTGHYIVRQGGSGPAMTGTGENYVEVVGGNQYVGGTHGTTWGEGGYVQAGVSGVGQAHFDFFGPIRETTPAYLWQTSGNVCIYTSATGTVDSGRISTPSCKTQAPGICQY